MVLKVVCYFVSVPDTAQHIANLAVIGHGIRIAQTLEPRTHYLNGDLAAFVVHRQAISVHSFNGNKAQIPPVSTDNGSVGQQMQPLRCTRRNDLFSAALLSITVGHCRQTARLIIDREYRLIFLPLAAELAL